MKNISLDNMSGQELKEMIDDEIIALEDLDNTALEKILDFETDMLCFGTGDMTIIRRCSLLLNKRNDVDSLNKDGVISIIDKAEKEHVIIVDEENTDKSKATVIRGKRVILRRIGLVAAVMAVLMSVTMLVAAAFGVDIIEYISKIVRQDEGEEINVDGFTFHNGGEVKQYSTIEEMVKSEGFNVLFPNKLPDGITVKTVILSKSVHGNDSIHITTNDVNTCVFIEINGNAPNGSHSDSVVYESNNTQYYIFRDDETFFASCYYNNCYYSIQAKSYNDLIFIIDNMKE